MMKKITLVLILGVLLALGQSLSAQCTTAASTYNDIATAQSGPICFNGTTCATADPGFTSAGVYGSEAYIITDIVAGSEYEFNMCSGLGAGSWIPEITILAADGSTVDAWNGAPATGSTLTFADNCTLVWTATQSGQYTIIINELGTFSGDAPNQTGCGSTLSTNNGNPTVTCGPSNPHLCLIPDNNLILKNFSVTDGVSQQINGYVPSFTVDFSKRTNVNISIDVENTGNNASDSLIITSLVRNQSGTKDTLITDTLALAIASGATYNTSILSSFDFTSFFPNLGDDAITVLSLLEMSSSNTELEKEDTAFTFIVSPEQSYNMPFSSSFEMSSITHKEFGWKFLDNDNDGNSFNAYNFSNVSAQDGNYVVIGSIANGNALNIGASNETLQSPELTLNGGSAYEFSIYAKTFNNQTNGEVALELTDASNSSTAALGTISLNGSAGDSTFTKYSFQYIVPTTKADYLVNINKSTTGLVFLDLFEINEISAPTAPTITNSWNACDSVATLNFNYISSNTYTINWGDGTPTETVTQSPATHTYATPGNTYIATISASNIIGNADATSSIDAETLSTPDATFTLNQNNANVSLSANDNKPCNTYTWSYGDNTADGSGSASNHTYSSGGEYTITLIVENPAGSNTTSQTIKVETGVGINEIGFTNGISVYPNPATDKLNVAFELNKAQDVEINLVTIDGRIVKTFEANNANEVNTTFKTNKLSTGLYILNVTTDEGKYTSNVVVK